MIDITKQGNIQHFLTKLIYTLNMSCLQISMYAKYISVDFRQDITLLSISTHTSCYQENVLVTV